MATVFSYICIIFVSLSMVLSQKIVKKNKCVIKTDEEMASFINKPIECEEIVDYMGDMMHKESNCNKLERIEGIDCSWRASDYGCLGTSTISKLKEKDVFEFAAGCTSITDVTDNKVRECKEHYSDLTRTILGKGKEARICKLVSVEPYTSMFNTRKAIFSTADDLNILEKYTGFNGLEAGGITMSLVKFDDVENLKKDEAASKAHTEPLPLPSFKIEVELVKTALAKSSGLSNDIGQKGETEKIKTDVHDLGEYDLRKKVKPLDELIIEDQWNNFGKIMSVGDFSNPPAACSATLIATQWILFAAHCVATEQEYNEGRAIEPKEVRFVVGMNGDAQLTRFKTPGQYRKLEEIYVPIGYMSPQFTKSQEFADERTYLEYDYALGKLDGPPFKHYMAIGYDSEDSFWNGDTVFDTAGYPGDLPGPIKKGSWLYFSPHSFKKENVEDYEAKESILKHRELIRPELVQDLQRYSYCGQSGSAVWAYKDNINQIMGILHGSCTTCSGRREKQKKLRTDNRKYGQKLREIEALFKADGECHKWKENESIEKELSDKCKQQELEIHDLQKKMHKNDLVLKWMRSPTKCGFLGTQVVRISAPKFWRWVHLLKLHPVTPLEHAALDKPKKPRARRPRPRSKFSVAQQNYYNMYMNDDINDDIYDGVYDDRYDDMNSNVMMFIIECIIITIITIFGCIFCFILGGFAVFFIYRIFHKNKNDGNLDNITDDTDIQV